MRYRALGNTGFQVSEIGFGAWAIGGPLTIGEKAFGWGTQKPSEAEAAIRCALEQGVNFFDTADVYGLGESERLLAKCIPPGAAWIATKVGNRRSREGDNYQDFSQDYLTRATEASLKRLHRDCIDLLQLHNPSLEVIEAGDCWEALERLRQTGKIRFAGVSVHKPEEALAVLRSGAQIVSLQLVYNLLNRKMADAVLPRAAKLAIGVIARVPLQYGALTGKFQPSHRFAVDDHRSRSLPAERIRLASKLLESLEPVRAQAGLRFSGLALKFVLSHPAVSVTIPGARNPDQVRDNVAASDAPPLSKESLNRIARAQQSLEVG